MRSPFHRSDLFQSLDITLAAVESCPEERCDELGGQFRADDFRAEAEHVHVVVLDPLVGGIGVVTDRGPDSGQLAGGDRGADARAAHEDTPRRTTVEDRLSELTRL